VDPQPVWEYTNVQKSSITPTITFEYPLTQDLISRGTLETTGKVNAIIVYTEWFLGDEIIKQQFENGCWDKKNQGVIFFNTEKMQINYSIKFSFQSGGVLFSFD